MLLVVGAAKSRRSLLSNIDAKKLAFSATPVSELMHSATFCAQHASFTRLSKSPSREFFLAQLSADSTVFAGVIQRPVMCFVKRCDITRKVRSSDRAWISHREYVVIGYSFFRRMKTSVGRNGVRSRKRQGPFDGEVAPPCEIHSDAGCQADSSRFAASRH